MSLLESVGLGSTRISLVGWAAGCVADSCPLHSEGNQRSADIRRKIIGFCTLIYRQNRETGCLPPYAESIYTPRVQENSKLPVRLLPRFLSVVPPSVTIRARPTLCCSIFILLAMVINWLSMRTIDQTTQEVLSL